MASTEGGAGPIVEDPDMTIQIAAGDGEMEILKRFIQAGVSVNNADGFGYTPLHAAAGYAQAEIAAYLLSQGANPNQGDCDGDTPLHNVESVEVARILLANGATLDAPNRKGKTPLYVALKDEREEVAEFLRSAGAGAIEVPPEGFPDSDSDGEIDMAIKRMFGLTHTTDEDREGEEGSETSFPDIGDDEEEGEDAAAAGGDGDVAA